MNIGWPLVLSVALSLIVALILGMFDGLPFLLGQLLLCLIIGALLGLLLGLLLGWLIWGRYKAQYDELETRLRERERELDRVKVDLASRAGELEQANTRLGTLESDLKARSDAYAGLETRFGQLETDLSAAREGRTDLEDELKRRTEGMGSLSLSLAAAQNDLDAAQQEASALKTQLAERKSDTPSPEAELKNRQTLSLLESQISEKDRLITNLRGQVESANGSGNLDGLRAELEASEGRVDQLTGELTRLRAQVDDEDALRERVARRYNVQDPDLSVRYMGDRLRLRGYVSAGVRNEAVSRAADKVGSDNVIDQLSTRGVVATPAWAASALRGAGDLGGVLKDATLQSDDGTLYLEGIVESASLKTQAEAALRGQVGEGVTIRNNLQIVGTDLQPDDLKDIKGIETVLEPVMHGIGIYTFRQIARWTQDDIEQVRESLQQFKTRIERENWVEQAKELHKEKYGEEL